MDVIENQNEYFITVDGQKLYGLQDLVIWLYNCSDKDFEYHVKNGNHFYDWIKLSLKEEELAEKIKDVKDRRTMIKILEDYLNKKFKFEKEDEDEYLASFINKYIMK